MVSIHNRLHPPTDSVRETYYFLQLPTGRVRIRTTHQCMCALAKALWPGVGVSIEAGMAARQEGTAC